jgi:formamidopyrimidine-DNA glycosylase
MPELPDVEIYLECLAPRVLGEPLERVRLASPFFLRSFDPPLATAEGKRVVALRRLGKRLVLGLEDDLFLVLHLMITGRLRWRPPGAKVPGRKGLAAFDFPAGTLLVTEMGAKKRASLHLVAGEAALAEHDPGGLEVLEADLETFAERLRAENRTLKRALTDPRILSGIGNAFSDEILHRAGLSPFLRTGQLGAAETERLYHAVRAVLEHWLGELRRRVGDGFPEKVTAFRKGFAVHGRYGEPCPDCGSPVQRVIYAENEANYCVVCQTGGRLLADRVLSRLMKEDWPRSLEEMEARKAGEA